MAYDTALAQIKVQLNAFSEKIRQISQDSANADYAENAGKLEGLTLEQVVELIAGTVGLTAQDVRDELHAFIARRDNPHEVDAEQVGLGELENYPVATEEEMDEGTIGRNVTAYLVRQAIDKSVADIEGQLEDLELTKEAVGLGNVENYAVANSEDDFDFFTENEERAYLSIQSASNSRYVTPQFLVEVIREWWSRQLGSTPETLDTIHEIAAALQENEDLLDSIADMVEGKATIEYVDEELGNKVDQSAYDSKISDIEDALEALENLEGLAIATDEQATETDLEEVSNEVLATPRSVLLQANLVRQESEDQLVGFMEDLADAIEEAAEILDHVDPALTISATVDNEEEEITIEGVSVGFEEGTTVNLTITDEEDDTMTRTATIQEDGTFGRSDLDISDLEPGTLTIDAWAEDADENEVHAEQISVEFDPES